LCHTKAGKPGGRGTEKPSAPPLFNIQLIHSNGQQRTWQSCVKQSCMAFNESSSTVSDDTTLLTTNNGSTLFTDFCFNSCSWQHTIDTISDDSRKKLYL